MTLRSARWRIGAVWFVGAGVVFLLLVAQCLVAPEIYGDRLVEAWGWFLPTVMPTLSLIVGVLVIEGRRRQAVGTAEAPAPTDEAPVVEGSLFALSMGLSFVYLLLVAATVLVPAATGSPPVDLMQRSNLWLGPLQGLTAGALAAFFHRG